MEKLIFAFRCTEIDFRSILLASSIRTFGGNLNNCPIILAYSNDLQIIPKHYQQTLQKLEVTIEPFSISKEFQGEFFADFIKGVAIIEKHNANKTENLVCLGPDTLILKEPSHFVLRAQDAIGYRPVHHTNIGSLYQEPLDEYWQLVYDLCKVSAEQVFPMETHADLNILRPYFNAGSLVVHPEAGLFQKWWDKYHEWHLNQKYLDLCKKKPVNHIFFHQAILTGLILNQYPKSKLRELPKTYNYPLHLHLKNPRKDKPTNFDELITIRYENREILDKSDLPLHIKSWISEMLIN